MKYVKGRKTRCLSYLPIIRYQGAGTPEIMIMTVNDDGEVGEELGAGGGTHVGKQKKNHSSEVDCDAGGKTFLGDGWHWWQKSPT